MGAVDRGGPVSANVTAEVRAACDLLELAGVSSEVVSSVAEAADRIRGMREGGR